MSSLFNPAQVSSSSQSEPYFQIAYNVMLPIFIGILIYALFRGIYIIDPNSYYFPLFSNNVPDWILYNLPDGLWFFSLLETVWFIWKGVFSRSFLIWIFLCCCLAATSEYLQLINFIPGTYDWLDLLTYFLATSIFLIKNKLKPVLTNKI